jgi:hypothetical protein
VALNAERRAEEARGHVRWLRPNYQIPKFGGGKREAEQLAADLTQQIAPAGKPSYPTDRDVDEVAAIMIALANASSPLDADALAQQFSQGAKVKPRIALKLSALARLGHLASADGKSYSLRRAA